MSQEAVLDLFRECGAMLEGHFELSSGLHSDRYFQCALLLQHPEQAAALARELARRVRADLAGGAPTCVIGPALGAVTWAYECARALGVRGLFSERKDGGMQLRRGFALRPGERVLVVEDVLTTGGSAREVVKLVRELGAVPVAVGAIVNRSGRNPFEEDGLPLFALAEVVARTWEPSAPPPEFRDSRPVKPGSKALATTAEDRKPGGRA